MENTQEIQKIETTNIQVSNISKEISDVMEVSEQSLLQEVELFEKEVKELQNQIDLFRRTIRETKREIDQIRKIRERRQNKQYLQIK